MSNKPLPTLSPSGWIHDVAKKADLLLSYFLVSEPAQSEIFNITTLQYILAKGGADDLILNGEITRALTNIFNAWFDSAPVIVVVRSGQDGDNETKLDISKAVTIVEGNQTYELAKLVATKNSKVYAISEINNG